MPSDLSYELIAEEYDGYALFTDVIDGETHSTYPACSQPKILRENYVTSDYEQATSVHTYSAFEPISLRLKSIVIAINKVTAIGNIRDISKTCMQVAI